ncbi:ParB/RepB/Spo0J family partition protein [Kribbella sp. CA-293567]|uniref:ParB/RepB/Spo0J family partition protein n=1 Tax=Kribbella sp. CA-293567 TaxID=3002436 RepID=UPI0022DDFBAD|nr:ParB/RepB/Spo0J family partition protein [Kribbella sp. CA-293567]WBQ07604.1 ParB/RepB/Spo0J family partition protein [Kribbella sp. CA-293567]
MQPNDVMDIPVDLLEPSKHQVRTRGVRRDLQELVDNIRVHGQLEPIVVVPGAEPGRYEIIAGQRRWLAIRELQLPTVRATVLRGTVDEAKARAVSMSENVVRHDVDSKDLIDTCTVLFRKYGSVKAVAEELGLPYNKVRSYVKFERLRPELKQYVESGDIDIKTALRAEDHLSTGGARTAEDVHELVTAIKGMTTAQQKDYLAGAAERPRPTTAQPRGKADRQNRPGEVRQIIVTLRTMDHQELRDWAAGQSLGQDAAAARIIAAFLRARRKDGAA